MTRAAKTGEGALDAEHGRAIGRPSHGPQVEMARRPSMDCPAWPGTPSRRAAATPASSAGRISGGSRRRTRQRAPAKARLATVAKPSSSARSASSRWAMRSPPGRSGSSTPHAVADARAARRGRTSSAPASPDEPHAQPPALEHQPGARVQVARVVADEVPEQPDRSALGAGRRAAACGRTTLAPRCGVELRDDPRVRDARQRDRQRQRLDQRAAATPAAMNGTTCATVVSVHSGRCGPGARRRRAGASGRPRARGAARRPRRAGASRRRSAGA